jgi:Copper transport outer membrane protein, MctB
VIDFRYHIVSIIAVFLALALGLFLGSTTLQSTVTRNLHHQADSVTSLNRSLTAQKAQLSSQLNDEQQFTAAVEPYAVADQLTGDTVALVSAPGVDGKTRSSVASTLQLAGATVTADVALQPAYLDPTQDAELGQLADQLALPSTALPQGNGASQASAVLAQVLLTRPGHRVVSRAHVAQTLAALSDGKFISVSGNPPARQANFAVMLVAAPDPSVTPKVEQAQDAILLGATADLRSQSTAAVIAGPPTPTGVPGGTLVAARADSSLTKSVSTVTLDPTGQGDPAAGRIAIVLVLAMAPGGSPGAYGLGLNPPLPSPTATP